MDETGEIGRVEEKGDYGLIHPSFLFFPISYSSLIMISSVLSRGIASRRIPFFFTFPFDLLDDVGWLDYWLGLGFLIFS